jgi:ankyrin repeat protein
MQSLAQRLIDLAKSVEPAGGFAGYYGLVDALEAKPAALVRFKALLRSAKWKQLDALLQIEKHYAWLISGAADAMDLLPDDSRLFLSAAAAKALPDKEIFGALCSAGIVNDKKTVARLAKRVDVNELDHNKQTALCYAVGNNQPDYVRILLSYGADPNRVQNCGNTAMHIAASSVCSREVFAMLLEAGGDVRIKNDEGKTVLQLLRKFKRSSWVNR